jgi:hypothetical protein
MIFSLFMEQFPDLGRRETRDIIIMPNHPSGLPAGAYSFLELYCNEPHCDCRRVMFLVVSDWSDEPLACIAYGWETEEFYRQWLMIDDPIMIAEMRGPSLNLASAQSSYAPILLDLAENVLLADRAYIERLKRHYQLMREKINSEQPLVAKTQRSELKKKRLQLKKKGKKRRK